MKLLQTTIGKSLKSAMKYSVAKKNNTAIQKAGKCFALSILQAFHNELKELEIF